MSEQVEQLRNAAAKMADLSGSTLETLKSIFQQTGHPVLATLAEVLRSFKGTIEFREHSAEFRGYPGELRLILPLMTCSCGSIFSDPEALYNFVEGCKETFAVSKVIILHCASQEVKTYKVEEMVTAVEWHRYRSCEGLVAFTSVGPTYKPFLQRGRSAP